MSDDPTPELTPEEEQVRRLLADARHTEPMPDDVADRLDAVLADLRDDPGGVPVRPAADLAAARRRRNARTWLVAAAAVVVVGVGVSQLDLSDLPTDSASNDSGPSAESAGDADAGAVGSAPANELAKAPARLDPDRFGEQVAALRDRRAAASLASEGSPQAQRSSNGAYDLEGCGPDPTGAGRVVPVRYEGQAGWLLFRKPQGDTQVVDLYLCGRDEPARSITLPTR